MPDVVVLSQKKGLSFLSQNWHCVAFQLDKWDPLSMVLKEPLKCDDHPLLKSYFLEAKQGIHEDAKVQNANFFSHLSGEVNHYTNANPK